MIIGYTAGVYDLFHVGHLNLLKMQRVCAMFVVGGQMSLLHIKENELLFLLKIVLKLSKYKICRCGCTTV